MNKFFLKKFDMKLAIFFLFLFLFEFLLFKSYVLREVVGYYPWAFDQSGYLMNSYASYEKLLSLGIKSGLSNTALPTSIIFIPFTTLFFLFFGATRLSALLINFFFFILLQIFSISTMKWFSQRNILCVMFCAALLSIATPLLNVGSLIDFRIDFLAFCLYGIFVCTIIRSKIFLDRKWTIIVAIVTSIMILMRCITAAYFFIEISILFLIVCFCIIRTKNSIKKKDALLRFKNILWLIGTCTISTIPFLWLNRQMIHDYYIVGHLIGPEKFIRMKEQGIINLFSDLIYYPHSILCNHLGKYGIVECTILFIVGLLSFFILKKQKKIKITSNKNDFFSSPSPYFTFLVLAILVPSIILTADSSKSPVGGGIVVVPILW